MLTRAQCEQIERKAGRLARKHGTRDPQRLAEQMNIMVDYAEHPSLLGFCGYMLGLPYIALNSLADETTCKCACAHELGHLALGHAQRGKIQVLRGTELGNMEAEMEAEANCFAAALLMDDEETIEALEQYQDAEKVAAALFVRPELLSAKCLLLQCKGVQVRVPEMRNMGSWKNQET